MKPEGIRAKAGFTLVELMIAFSIFMVVMLAIYSTWSAILKGTQTGLQAAATAQRSRVAVHALEDAFTCATMFAGNLRYYSFLADTDPSGDFSAVEFTAHLPASFPGSGLFGDQTVRRVSFYVEADPDYGRRLVMVQTPLLEQASPNPQGYPLVLSKGVRAFLIEYWDNRQGDWSPDPPPTNAIPPLVRITLASSSSKDRSAPPDIVTRIIKPAAVAVLPSMQAPLLPPGIGPGFAPPGVTPGAPTVPGGVNPVNPGPGGPTSTYYPPGAGTPGGVNRNWPPGPPPPSGFY
jgi:type II secretory pathway pseudopilin PulG